MSQYTYATRIQYAFYYIQFVLSHYMIACPLRIERAMRLPALRHMTGQDERAVLADEVRKHASEPAVKAWSVK
jgi:hypothetical protein